MTVEDLRERMSSSEYIGWLAYFKLKNDRHEKEMLEARQKAGR